MTTLREAAKAALWAFQCHVEMTWPMDRSTAAIAALRAALAQQDEPDAYGYAARLAVAIWEKHYKDTAPQWKPLDYLIGVLTQIDNMTSGLTRQAQQAEPVQEPVARECSDPMCACRGGPCAECEEGEREKEIEDLRSSLYFYQRRCEALQSWQSKMRDPERTIVCDILANGKTLDPAFAGDRYTAPPQQAEPVQEPVAWLYEAGADRTLHWYKPPLCGTPLYTAPPQRQPLTDEEILKAIGWERAEMYMKLTPNFPVAEAKKETLKNARAIERAHGIGEAK